MITCTITNKPNSVNTWEKSGETYLSGIWPWPERPPRKVKKYDTRNLDPHLRLMQAVAARAVIDLVWPTLKLEPDERDEALDFVIAHRELYIAWGVPEWKYNALVRYAQNA